jgi:hypothetical protein
MAVTYHHRLVISGPPKELKAFRDAVGLTVTRRPAAKVPEWCEYVPISFSAMYARCPRLARVEPNLPYDPYDISWWPKRSLPDGREEIRYQFHIRNLEMRNFLAPFSREFPQLGFKLVIFCLDDCSIDSYLISNGKTRKYTLPPSRNEWHWERARKRFEIEGDELYEDEDARLFAEEGMLEEALDHWQLATGNRGAVPVARRKRRNWWNRPSVRNLEFEQKLAMAEISQSLADEAAAKRSAKKKRHA